MVAATVEVDAVTILTRQFHPGIEGPSHDLTVTTGMFQLVSR
jgi:hypothetical protein